jgi:uncharacterized membrane protein (UPF0127 family)|tara:strand:+ start:2839 stop:3207 length:369 start_codon:yes stop_codon:yes gene_type:complete
MIQLGNKKFNLIEVADEPTSWARGLSGKTSIPSGTGMLFSYHAPYPPQSFWMRGMLFSIDIIFIGPDNTVTGVVRNLPVPTPDKGMPKFSSFSPVKYALEVNSGESEGIKKGDSCKLIRGTT